MPAKPTAAESGDAGFSFLVAILVSRRLKAPDFFVTAVNLILTARNGSVAICATQPVSFDLSLGMPPYPLTHSLFQTCHVVVPMRKKAVVCSASP